jgi:hypothetical protein
VWIYSNTLLASARAATANSKQAAIPLTDGGWHYVVVTKTSQQITHIYYDGADVTTADVIDFVGVPGPNYLGVWGDGTSNAFNGGLDELRLFNGTLAAGWISAEYNNQKPSSTFLTVGGEI